MPPSSQMAIQLTLILISCILYSMYSPPSSSSVSSSLPAPSWLALLVLVISTCVSLLFSNLRHLLKSHTHKVQTTTSPPSMDEVPEEKSIVLLQDEVAEDEPQNLTRSISESSDGTADADDERAEVGSASDDDESLIEISLVDGHYVGVGQGEQCAFREEELVLAEFLPDMGIDKRDSMDILSEISEEDDSMIEIDIARGSIKCSNLGIKA